MQSSSASAPRSLTELAERDGQRPRFHVVAPAGWLNDPNGLGQVDGRYHVFYQYNPHGAVHDRIHWGHASSDDLVTWTDEPVALVPSEDGPDRDGCWSGVLVDDGGTPTLIYSGHRDGRELPCVAVGSPDLRTWQPDAANPVISAPPEDLHVTGFRDHCVWREGGMWRQLVGSGVAGGGGAALLYESRDLRSWSYLGPLVAGAAPSVEPSDPLWTGTMWECVDLFRLRGVAGARADVLLFSACGDGELHHALAWTGTYAADGFVPERLHRLDLGGRDFYAPQSVRDEQGRRLVIGWLQEARPSEVSVANGWAGALSLPREVTIGPSGSLFQAPVTEVASLRGDPVGVPAQSLEPGDVVRLLSGDQLDLELAVRLERGARIDLVLRATPDGEEHTVLHLLRPPSGHAEIHVVLDRSRSSLQPGTDTTERSGVVAVDEDGIVAVRVLVDHSVIEAFVAGVPLTARVYPTRVDALGVSLERPWTDDSAAGTASRVMVDRAVAWPMRDAWRGARNLWPSAPEGPA